MLFGLCLRVRDHKTRDGTENPCGETSLATKQYTSSTLRPAPGADFARAQERISLRAADVRDEPLPRVGPRGGVCSLLRSAGGG